MTDTTDKKYPPITLDTIVGLGQKRVGETRVVEIPSLGGTVTLRQLSGADQDAAVALGHAGPSYDAHAIAREQIKRSLVEPALPEAEADDIIDNLPVQAFGELQAIVQANSGLLPGTGVEELVRSFRAADIARREDAAGGAVDSDAADADGVGSNEPATADGDAGVSSVDDDGAPRSGEAAVDAVEVEVEAAGVSA